MGVIEQTFHILISSHMVLFYWAFIIEITENNYSWNYNLQAPWSDHVTHLQLQHTGWLHLCLGTRRVPCSQNYTGSERKHTRCWDSEAKTNWPRYASNVKALTSNKHTHIVYVTFSILCILLLIILQIHKLIRPLAKVTLHTLSSHAPPVFCFCLPEQGNYHSHSPAPSPSISYKSPDSCIVCWTLTDRTGTDRLLLAALFSMLHFRPLNNNSIK